MAPIRTRGMSLVLKTVSIAEQLHHDCSILLELYRKKESFTSSVTVADSRLVSVQLSSDNQSKLRVLNSALVQCRGLLDKAISKEEEEIGGGEMGDYEKQRKVVHERLSFLIGRTGELLISQYGSTLITSSVGPVVECPSVLFDLKLWVYRVFKELDYWAKTAISTLEALKELAGEQRVRRSSRLRR